MTRQLPTDDTDNARPPSKSVLKRQAKNDTKNAKKRARSNKVAKAALTDFEGHRVPAVHNQHRGLFNSKYQRLAGMHTGMGQAETSPTKNTGKKKGEQNKELAASVWSIDYKQFEMPADSSRDCTGLSGHDQQPITDTIQARRLPNPPPVVRDSLASGHYSDISNEDNEHNLREYDIGNSLVLSAEQFGNQIPFSNIDDLNDLTGSADPITTFTEAESRALDSTIEYLESGGEGITDSAQSSKSAIVTFDGSLPHNVQSHHQKTEPKDKELNFTPRDPLPSTPSPVEPIYAKIHKSSSPQNPKPNQNDNSNAPHSHFQTEPDTESEIDVPVTSIDDLIDTYDLVEPPTQFLSSPSTRESDTRESDIAIELCIRDNNSFMPESALTTMQDRDRDVAL